MIIEYDTRINLAMVAHASCFIFFFSMGERRAGGSNNKNKASGIAPNGTQFKLKFGHNHNKLAKENSQFIFFYQHFQNLLRFYFFFLDKFNLRFIDCLYHPYLISLYPFDTSLILKTTT